MKKLIYKIYDFLSVLPFSYLVCFPVLYIIAIFSDSSRDYLLALCSLGIFCIISYIASLDYFKGDK